jgi:hypothetical protein
MRKREALMSALPRQLMTPREVGRELGKSTTTVQTWCERGILPAVRINSRWYLKRPELVREGWLPPDNEEAAATGKVATAEREG